MTSTVGTTEAAKMGRANETSATSVTNARAVVRRRWHLRFLGLVWGLCACCSLLASILASTLASTSAMATEIQLKDGRIYAGREGLLQNLAEPTTPKDMEAQMDVPTNIVFIDDGLRRTYFPKRLVTKVANDNKVENISEKYVIKQDVRTKGPSIVNPGGILRMDPFDDFGRRIVIMNTGKGTKELVQCITELTPQYAQVQCTNYIWDMRIATNSIPADQLLPLLRKQSIRSCKGNEVEAAKKTARFLLQAEQYERAAREVNRVMHLAKDKETVKKELGVLLMQIRQLSNNQILSELDMRRKNGQYELVRAMLKDFPTDGIAGETLQKIKKMQEEFDQLDERINHCITCIQKLWKQIDDPNVREVLKPVLVEILEELNYNNLVRLEAFEQMLDVEGADVNEQIALLVTSWLMGSKDASNRIVIATSAVRVRRLIQQYLEAGSDLELESLYQNFQSEEAAIPRMASAIIANMKPPVPVKKEEWLGKDGYFHIKTHSTSTKNSIEYWVQLPLEYDPYRRYPVVVSLPGIDEEPENAMRWWAGEFNPKGYRQGQAGRNGYVVIVPKWANGEQREYEFSRREHEIVLGALHDACQRFSIDTDRAFLTGHAIGGDAAWDIGLAHPDLWAGMVLVCCEPKKYCIRYWKNAKLLPTYHICGAMHNLILGDAHGSYMSYYFMNGFDTTIVEYLGRGYESYQDEILRIFDWMGRKQRNFYPAKFEVHSMRPWDNMFWWVEAESLPPRSIVLPDNYHTKGVNSATIEAELITKGNTLRVRTAIGDICVWVGPKMLDFDREINIVVNGKDRVTNQTVLKPDLRVLLDDVRRRGDRQNPFWAKMNIITGKK